MTEVLKGNAATCWRLRALVAVVALVLGAAVHYFWPLWRSHVVTIPSQEQLPVYVRWMTWLLISASFLTGALAAYLWRCGIRTLKSGIYPPPGTLVCKDSVLIHGAAARLRGRLFQLAAALLAAGAVAILVAGWAIADFLR